MAARGREVQHEGGQPIQNELIIGHVLSMAQMGANCRKNSSTGGLTDYPR